MKDGYWLNSRTGAWINIQEHSKCLQDRNIAAKLDLGIKKYKHIKGLSYKQYRLEILLIAMSDSLIRIRCHRSFITFEYTAESSGNYQDIRSLIAIYNFIKDHLNPAPLTRLHLCNIYKRSGLNLSWNEFIAYMNLSPGIGFKPIQINYSIKEIEEILNRIKSISGQDN